jgi:acyl-CoA thioesterase-1
MMSDKRALLASVLILLGCGGSDSDVVRRGPSEGSSTPTARQATEDEGPDDLGVVAFIGTSLTAGYGLSDPSGRYTDVLQGRIGAAGLPFSVLNAGVSGDTSRGGLERLDWLLRSDPVVLVIELGANDGLRGIDPASMSENIQAIVDHAREARGDIRFVMVGMQAPPNLGPDYAEAFSAVFLDLADRNGMALVPFLLDGVGGVPELNQEDGIHPTAEGHRIMADNVWSVLEPLLRELAEARTEG